MANEHPSHSYQDVLQDYYGSASVFNTEFKTWVRESYSIYTKQTVSSYMTPSAEGKKYCLKGTIIGEFLEIPSRDDEHAKLSQIVKEDDPELSIFCTDKVDRMYEGYTMFASSGSAAAFASYARKEMNLPMEPSQVTIFGKEFGRKKTPQEIATEERLKREKGDEKKKEEEKRRIANLERQAHVDKEKRAAALLEEQRKKDLQAELKIQELRKKQEQIVIKTAEKELEGRRTRLEEKTINDERIKELNENLKDVKQRQTDQELSQPSQAIFGGIFKKSPEPAVFEWTDNDAYVMFQALIREDNIKAKDAARIGRMIKHLTGKNHYIKSLMETTVKPHLNVVDRNMVCKMLSMVKDNPDTFGSAGVPKTKYVGAMTRWDDPSNFTVADYNDIRLAHDTLCSGEVIRQITKSKVREAAPSSLEKAKEVFGIDSKQTIEWGDDLAEAVKLKLVERSPQIDLSITSKLSPFVKAVCKNGAVEEAVGAAKRYINNHGGPPITDLGVALLFSLWRFHPTRDEKKKDLETSRFVEGPSPKVMIIDKLKTDNATSKDLVEAYHVYQKMIQMGKKNSVLQMEVFSPSSDRFFSIPEATKKQAEERLFNGFCKRIESLTQGDQNERALKVRSDLIKMFGSNWTFQQFKDTIGANSSTDESLLSNTYFQLKMIINSYGKLLDSLNTASK